MKTKFERYYYKGEDYVMFSLYSDEGLTEQGELRMQETEDGLKLIAYSDSFYLLHDFQDIFKFSLENKTLQEFITILQYNRFKELFK